MGEFQYHTDSSKAIPSKVETVGTATPSRGRHFGAPTVVTELPHEDTVGQWVRQSC